jgi:transposase-like protein
LSATIPIAIRMSFTASVAGFCSGVDILCVRWYLQIKLNLRNLVEMMAERGPAVAHAKVMRRVQRYAPEFEERGARFARSVGRSWRVDEKYVKIRGEWCYLYRAGDRAGGTIDFRLSAKGAVAAATAFFRKVNKSQPLAPLMITQDGCAASHRAVRELKAEGSLLADTKVHASKYLNNLELSHRAVRQRIAAMLGLKSFGNARIAVAGIEPMRSHSRGTVRIGAARTFKGEPRWHGWGTRCVVREVAAKDTGERALS